MAFTGDNQQPNVGASNNGDSSQQPGNHVVLPKVLQSIPKATELPQKRHRWNINEEIASWLTTFEKHEEWISTTPKTRPQTGSIFLYNRKKVKHRHDGYVWKRRREGKSTREDHMKLKVKGEECLYGGYVHSAIVPTFHRRSYWLLQNPDIVLVHYLNDSQPDGVKDGDEISLVFNPLLDSREWEKAELIEQVQPMFEGLKLRVNGTTEPITGSASLEALVQYMLAEQAKLGNLHTATKEPTCSCQRRKAKEHSHRRKKGLQSKADGRHSQPHTPMDSSPSPMNSPDPEIAPQPIFNLQPLKPLKSHIVQVPPDIFLGLSQKQNGATFDHSPADYFSHSLSNTQTVSDSSTLMKSNEIVALEQNNSRDVAMAACRKSAMQNTLRNPTLLAGPGIGNCQNVTSVSMETESLIYSPPRITSEECQTLRSLVDNDPNLKTAKNRFRNLGRSGSGDRCVILPKEVLNHLPSSSSVANHLVNTTAQSTSQANVPFFILHEGAPDAMDLGTGVQSGIAKDIFTTSVLTPVMCNIPVTSNTFNEPTIQQQLSEIVAKLAEGQSPTVSLSNAIDTSTAMLMQVQGTRTSIPDSQNSFLSQSLQNHPHITILTQPQQEPTHLQTQPSTLQQSPAQQPLLQHSQTIIPQNDTNMNAKHQDQDRFETNSLPSPLEIDFDPFEMFGHALPDLDSETLTDNRAPENNSQTSDHIMDLHNSTNRMFLRKSFKDSGNASVESAEDTSGTEGGSVVEIADFSPDWSYPEGGIKVLVAGPWQPTDAAYTCVFDNFAVPASLLQTGVLRCFCPAHEKGLVPLHVCCNGTIISKSVLFEFKARRAPKTALAESNQQSQPEWLVMDEKQFKMLILDRLEQIERQVSGLSKISHQQGTSGLCNSDVSFEDRIIGICEKLMQITSGPLCRNIVPQRGMTMLHLAAALGYANLVKTLMKWRQTQNNVIIEIEMDPMTVDNQSCTPMMWTCALGHRDAALRLYQWNPNCLFICNRSGRTPIEMARLRGHVSLANCLLRLQCQNQRISSQMSHSEPSKPIEIPSTSSQRLPSFMISSPASQTPDSSFASDFSPVAGDAFSSSSGVLSQLSVSPVSQSCNTTKSPSSTSLNSPLVNSPSVSSPSVNSPSFSSPQLSPQPRSDTSDSSIPSSLYEDIQALLEMDPELDLTPRNQDGPGPSLFKIPPRPPPPPPLPFSSFAAALMKDALKCGPKQGNPFSFPPSEPTTSENNRDLKDQLFDLPQFKLDRELLKEMEKIGGDGIAASLEKLKNCVNQLEDGSREGLTPSKQYLTLAEQILEALPAHIKEDGSSPSSFISGDFLLQGMSDILPPLSVMIDEEMEEASDDFEGYRSATDINSPTSTYSTTDDSCMPSPQNMSFDEEGSTADWSEFLQGKNMDGRMLCGFSLLTLSDEEQRQLYKAALVIQNAFRQYKGRQQQKQQELEAAVIIQSYYRRYKQYVTYVQMSEAAKVIQSHFRSYQSYRRFQQSRQAAIVIQSRYRSYRAKEQFKKSRDAAILIQQRFRDKRMARMKKEQDAARKIQRFIRHYQNRLKQAGKF